MIKIDFSLAIAVLLSGLLMLLFGAWINQRGRQSTAGFQRTQNLYQCPYCTHLFYGEDLKDIINCPKCDSYFNRPQTDG